MLDFRSACELAEEYPHIIAVNLAMSILVNHPEDRQDRVVELADELLLEHLHAFQTFNLSTQNSNHSKLINRTFVIFETIQYLLLDDFHHSVLDVI